MKRAIGKQDICAHRRGRVEGLVCQVPCSSSSGGWRGWAHHWHIPSPQAVLPPAATGQNGGPGPADAHDLWTARPSPSHCVTNPVSYCVVNVDERVRDSRGRRRGRILGVRGALRWAVVRRLAATSLALSANFAAPPPLLLSHTTRES